MTRERIYVFDTTLRDGQQTPPPGPQRQSREDGQAKYSRVEA